MPESYWRRNTQRDARIDYSRGNFFVTIGLNDRKPLFGSAVDGVLKNNVAGQTIESVWLALPDRFPGLVLDCQVVMPDHFHAVLAIVEPGLTHPECQGSRPLLTEIVRFFKSLPARAYGEGVRGLGWPPYLAPFWQPDF